MAYAVVLVFDGVTEADYWAVNSKLGIGADGKGDYPAGMITHAGAPTATGGWMVSEIWDSRESQQSFMAGKLGAALQEVGLPDPVAFFDGDTVNVYQLG